MKQAIVLSLQPARFKAATFNGALAANLNTIASLGYQGVELAIRDPKLVGQHQLDLLIRQNGLHVPAIGTGQAWGEDGLSFTNPDLSVRKQAIERILAHLPLAAHFNAIVILGLIRGTIEDGVKPTEAMNWLYDALTLLDQAAAKLGVRLAIEPINHQETSLINKAQDALKLINELSLKNIGLLLDTYHMNIEEKDINDCIRACGKYIFHIHVADSNRMYPGAGSLDFHSILTTLSSVGYEDWISGEFLPKPSAELAAQRSITHLRSLDGLL